MTVIACFLAAIGYFMAAFWCMDLWNEKDDNENALSSRPRAH